MRQCCIQISASIKAVLFFFTKVGKLWTYQYLLSHFTSLQSGSLIGVKDKQVKLHFTNSLSSPCAKTRQMWSSCRICKYTLLLCCGKLVQRKCAFQLVRCKFAFAIKLSGTVGSCLFAGQAILTWQGELFT